MKNFVKALDKNGTGYDFLRQKFPKISCKKLKAGIFGAPQIRELVKDSTFDDVLNSTERSAWQSPKSVISQFLGNRRSPEYEEIVEQLLENFRALGARMSKMMHCLRSYLDYLPDNCGDFSEEQGERIHLDIRVMEERYQGYWDVNFLAN